MKTPPEEEMRRLLEPSSAELLDTVSRSLERIRRHRPRQGRILLVLAGALAVALLWISLTRDGSPEVRRPESRTLALTNHGRVVLVVDAETDILLIRGGERSRDGSRAAGRRFLISSRGDE
jgi:hypothetical protein